MSAVYLGLISFFVTESFQSLGTKNDVKIFVSQTEGQKVYLIKGVTHVRATRDTIKRCFLAPCDDSFNHLFSVIDPMVRILRHV